MTQQTASLSRRQRQQIKKVNFFLGNLILNFIQWLMEFRL